MELLTLHSDRDIPTITNPTKNRMKKLYTLALAALTAVSAMAFQQAPSKTLDSKVTLTQSALKTTALNKSYAGVKAQLPVSADFVGPRVLVTFEDPIYENYECEIAAGTAENKYQIKNFLASYVGTQTNPLDCTVADTVVNEQTITLLTIPGGGKTPLFTNGGSTYSLYLFGYKNGNPSVYPNDITFVVIGKTLIPYYENTGIAFITPERRGSWVMNPMMFAPNGKCDWTDITLDQSGNISKEEAATIQTYNEFNAETNQLMSFNCIGVERPITFSINDDGTADATDQVVAASRKTQSGQNTGDFILGMTPDFETSTPVVNATVVNNEDGTSTLTWEQGTWWGYSEMGYYWTIGQNTVMTMNFSIPGLPGYVEGSVGNIAVDNSNAPVEYFNLQGVRVANPENGLFIRRQGTSVTKVVK